jgi:hypothetical protein
MHCYMEAKKHRPMTSARERLEERVIGRSVMTIK